MKKLGTVLLISVLGLALFTGCTAKGSDEKTIVVGASPTPHAEILAVAGEVLKEEGYTLEVKEFTDYVQPNLTLANKELDANFFQHLPYLEDFNDKNNTKLVSAGAVHYEPLGLYPGKIKTLDAIVDGSTIAIPNDTTNEARALLLLETIGLIKVDPNAGLEATPKDVIENPKNIAFKELEAAQLARSLQDVDLAVINGNYAIEAGLNVKTDAIAKEEKDSLAAQTYANIVAVRAGDEKSDKTVALMKALTSEKVKAYIEDTYQGAVVPIF
ncbi:MetQ/NlpA family ABC transporter substrate-binding protein [Acetobacterium woodii]|uniref:Lipoprotein n=1 Tax=Acetobacterium woodii (strain ATCC 29683 / DSM 1030 / JCM 2381 / KCTC 1655 / WB1) TaxID=931626 RepID=H6LGY3_ACEWD|nr:MetQ/NlpA family ABC transporter substrate-binding protein [Acetobacterium woodii]AFA47121.1 D-methionine transport system substrate-binding protein MetQ [Acetobacterium woodii DSM 1030]